VLIHNVSATGLLIQSAVALADAERIEIPLPQVGATSAHVVWTSEDFYGCRFDTPVPASALSALELYSRLTAAPAPGEPGDTLPVRIARLRKQQGLTLEALASLLKVSKPTVWAWEQGKARPTPERITALAERLGVDAEELRTGRDGDALAEALSHARRLVAKAYGVDPARVKVSIEL
jgi:transcriptional regulator with XRE-family HTH domain